ncbi:hypothetical protein D3C77_692460 [compost metagenome]
MLNLRHQNYPDAEENGKYNSQRGVLLNSGIASDEVYPECRQHPRQYRPDHKQPHRFHPAKHKRDANARQSGMSERIPQQTLLAQEGKGADHSAA